MPHPLGPVRATISPGATSRPKPSSAGWSRPGWSTRRSLHDEGGVATGRARRPADRGGGPVVRGPRTPAPPRVNPSALAWKWVPTSPQRQVGLGGEDEHEERRLEPDVAVEQPQADRHRDEGHGDAGQQLEHERREEGQPQGRHRRPPVAVGHGADGVDLRLRAAEDLERRQAGHDVEEVAGQPLQRAQLAVGAGCGSPSR